MPVYLLLGNHSDAALRRAAEWYHGVHDAAAMVRDYTKWDDTPWSLTHFAESAVRAYKVAITPPMAPVVLVLDGHLQEAPISRDAPLRVPNLTVPTPPRGESSAVEEAARLLVAAEHPVLVADRLARTPAGMTLLVELAETLQASIIDHDGARISIFDNLIAVSNALSAPARFLTWPLERRLTDVTNDLMQSVVEYFQGRWAEETRETIGTVRTIVLPTA